MFQRTDILISPRVFLLLALLLFHAVSYGQKSRLEYLLIHGQNEKVIEEGELQLLNASSTSDSLFIYDLMCEAQLQLNHYPEYVDLIHIKKRLNPDSAKALITYNIDLANNFHHQLRMDSAIFCAGEAMKLFQENGDWTDSNLVYHLYSKFGNCLRNGGVEGLNKVKPKNNSLPERIRLLNLFEDTALLYTTNDYQKADVYHKKATIYLDLVADYGKYKNPEEVEYALEQSNANYELVIKYSKSSAQIGSAYSLIGLNHHYFKHYQLSNDYSNKALHTLLSDSLSNSLKIISLLKWKGWNLEEWYAITKDSSKLNEAIETYKQNIEFWSYYTYRMDKSMEGFHDGYRVSAYSSLAITYYQKFVVTGDSTYMNESFRYSDLAKYQSYPSTPYSIKTIQEKLMPNQAFIQNTTNFRPYKELNYIIQKDKVTIILNDNIPEGVPYYRLNELYQFLDLELFKKWSYQAYTSLFQEVDSVLLNQNISHVIVSNSDFNAMLNYDLFISDTLSNDWKTQSYLFHRYRFSYSLCARSFLEERQVTQQSPRLGISIGDFSQDVNLRFSKKFALNLEQKYHTANSSISTVLNDNNVVLFLEHGNSDFNSSLGELRISKDSIFSTKEVFNCSLNNDLVIVTACNSNLSQTNYSEGSTGNFAKAFRYAGAKSTLTTSWEIDDKANAFIMERFVANLAKGMPKSDALWNAKKEYWNQATIEEEFKPLYWAGYILTGSTEPVVIEQKEKPNFAWLGIFLLIPIGYLGWRKLKPIS